VSHETAMMGSARWSAPIASDVFSSTSNGTTADASESFTGCFCALRSRIGSMRLETDPAAAKTCERWQKLQRGLLISCGKSFRNEFLVPGLSRDL
jgi:hypothetical protein